MPLILTQNIDNGQIGLWKVSEDIEQLLILANLSAPDLITYSAISALHRKKEWLATRALLYELTKEHHLIKYHSDGRPYIENFSANISITHSTGYIALMLHFVSNPGIDIELITRKVGSVGSRFLSSDEMTFCNEDADLSNRLMLLHWCAKEAIYKMVPFSNIEFATDIRIILSNTIKGAGSFQGIFNDKSGQVSIALYYETVGEVLIVWGAADENKFHY
jgi:4'-phosphopantetheinyl transferase